MAQPASPLRRPAEWLRHSRTILAWPGRKGYLSGHPARLSKATEDVTSIARAVARFEPVTLLVDKGRFREVQRTLSSMTPSVHEIQIQSAPGNDVELWMRDIAPTFVVKHDPRGGKRSLCGVDFNFNGWGGKLPTGTTRVLARAFLQDNGIERIESSIVAEGGALETDGHGTLLATESSLVNQNRNPGKTRLDIELELRRVLGIRKVIWIPGRKDLDITDCHIDALARFARRGTVLLSKPNKFVEGDTDWTAVYSEARDILLRATDASDEPLEVIEIEEANPPSMDSSSSEQQQAVYNDEDWGPPVLSYVNYLIVNGGVILPQFGDMYADARALKIMQQVFGSDGREVVPVLIRELPLQGGGIHCASQEVPFIG